MLVPVRGVVVLVVGIVRVWILIIWMRRVGLGIGLPDSGGGGSGGSRCSGSVSGVLVDNFGTLRAGANWCDAFSFFADHATGRLVHSGGHSCDKGSGNSYVSALADASKAVCALPGWLPVVMNEWEGTIPTDLFADYDLNTSTVVFPPVRSFHFLMTTQKVLCFFIHSCFIILAYM